MTSPTLEELQTEIDSVLPEDIPNREQTLAICAKHLQLVLVKNQQMNLTSITAPREASIKHVWDSIEASPLLYDAQRVLDLGSGAGFPGIPLAAISPEKQFLLVESKKKKAAFLEEALSLLPLSNVEVHAVRTEELLKSRKVHVDTILVRAVGKIPKILNMLGEVRKSFNCLLLYKGGSAQEEIDEAKPIARQWGLYGEIVHEYELPEQMGTRTLVEYRKM
ncbi:16S rRNA (guanine(527)-N(7))-methyltransferase [hydrothermal vent metagenome]|uniref:16S rRNA (Guanine(527)-N(7))-methyltransferase n=1 Tax=hydrothermal vent metagenome TaxID=652676 RepID=A0A3B1DD93_9ZZZZ